MDQSTALKTIDLSPDLTEGRRVLQLEADALSRLAESLGQNFVNSLDLLQSIKGRIIVTGMGKSGHIAGKIAATLASTGSPAFFVHPAEASHGDLGMISPTDAVIALSNSGETVELSNLIHYTKRHDIPLIAITSKETSALAQAADCLLLLPKVGEACPIGLAPTTSTTLMLALGDAIATSLLRRNGFSSSDFSRYHPGGSLGSRLQKVSDIMHESQDLPLASMDTLMSDVLVTMTSKSFGCVGVTDQNGKIVGIITDGDLRRHMSSDLLAQKAKDVMTPSPLSIGANALIAEAVQIMNSRKITSLFVCAESTTDAFEPIGILHIHDCLRAGER